jgi:hypothetical protein
MLLSVAISGCSNYKIFVTPEDVSHLPSDTRIWYEDGAYEKAKLISENLDIQVDKIEKAQYLPFKQPINIYVFSKQKSFEKYSIVGKAGAVTYGDKILISPKKANTDLRLPGMVLHELSHFHLFGYLGLYKSRITPRWFLEGLAVWVSDGAGAEKVSRDDAIKEILAGNKLNPVTRHPIFFGEKSKPSGMKPHMFYRQSALFVEYMHESSPGGFKILLQGIEDGDSFDNIFEKAYEKNPNIIWDLFVNSLKHNQAFNVDLGDATHPSAN